MKQLFRALTTLVAAAAAGGCNVDSVLQSVDLGQSALVLSASNVAAGTDAASVRVHVARGDGTPMQGIPVALSAEFCSVKQAPGATDANGDARGQVACSGPLLETVQATLAYQGFTVPVPRTATVNFYAPSDGNRGIAPGQALSVQAVALDTQGQVDTGYRGQVRVSSTDPNAILPPSYTFTAADQGYKIWPQQAVLSTRGTQSITVTDANTGRVLGRETFIVTKDAHSAPAFVTSPNTATAGVPITFEVDALFANGDVDPDYTSTVSFASSDNHASLPSPYSFTRADKGRARFAGAVSFTRTGPQTLVAIDNTSSAVAAIQVNVVASGVTNLAVDAPLAVEAGVPFAVQAYTVDGFGNRVAGVATLPITIASSDANATLPGVTALQPNGTIISGVTLRTAGLSQLSVRTQGTLALVGNATVAVGPGPATALQFACDANPVAGSLISLAVTAVDTWGNIATGYRGTTRFTGSDPNGVYPGSYTFVSTDGGAISLANTASMRTAGLQNLQVVDTTDSSLHAQQSVHVHAGSLAAIYVEVPAHVSAGAAATFTLVAGDAYQNPVTDYVGLIQVSSTDTGASFPVNVALGTGNAGTLTLPAAVTFRTSGDQNLIATDGHGYSGASATHVASAASTRVVIGNVPGTTVPTQPVSPTLQVQDAFGNIATQYTGTFAVTVSPNTARYTTNVTFGGGDAGQKSLPYDWAFGGVGVYTVSVTDGNLATRQNITIAHGCRTYDGETLLNDNWDCCDLIHMALDHNDNPIVTYTSPNGGPLQTSVSRWTGTGWTTLPKFTFNSFRSHVVVDANNAIALGYVYGTSFPQTPALISTYGPTGWTATAGDSNAVGFPSNFSTLAGDQMLDVRLDSHGGPWLVVQQTINNVSQVVLHRWTGSAFSTVPANGTVSIGGVNSQPSLRMTPTDLPVVAWESDYPGNMEVLVATTDANYATWTGPTGTPSYDNISNSPGQSIHPVVVLDAAGAPIVAWDDDTSGASQIYVKALVAGAWQELGGSATGGGISQSSATAAMPALALDSTGAPVVVWLEQGCPRPTCLYMRRWSGTGWDEINGSASGTGIDYYVNPNFAPDIAIDSSDTPVITYSQGHPRTCNWR